MISICVKFGWLPGIENIDLIFDYADWVLKKNPEDGLKVSFLLTFTCLAVKFVGFGHDTPTFKKTIFGILPVWGEWSLSRLHIYYSATCTYQTLNKPYPCLYLNAFLILD